MPLQNRIYHLVVDGAPCQLTKQDGLVNRLQQAGIVFVGTCAALAQ
jgi:hypothetical protein